MRIALFADGVSPLTDRPLVRKSETYIKALVAAGEAFMINARQAQLYSRRQLEEQSLLSLKSSPLELRSEAAISAREMGLNVGDGYWSAVLRAQRKIQAYPFIWDQQAPLCAIKA